MKNQGYYTVLGIDRSATGAEVKHAYHRLAHRLHPDVSNDPDGEQKFKNVTEAYRTLKCAETRTAYNLLHAEIDPDKEQRMFAEPLQAWYALYERLGWAWFWPD